MVWRRHNAKAPIRPVGESTSAHSPFDPDSEFTSKLDSRKVVDLRIDGITAVARAAGEDPDRLLREVRAFRSALPARRAVAAAVDAVAASAYVLRDPGGRLATNGTLGEPFHLDDDRPGPAEHRRPHRRGLSAAAGLLVVALLSGTTVAVVASRDGSHDRSRVQALEFHAAQQYGVLALAVQDRSPGQIVAASVALHASLLPLMQEAQTDEHAAKTAMLLLTNERALLMSTQTQDASIATALHQTQTLLSQLQNTAKTPVPAALPTVVLPPVIPSTAPPVTAAPTTPPTTAPSAPPTPPATTTPTPPVVTPTPELPPPTPTPEPTTSVVLIPQVTPSPNEPAPDPSG